MASESTSLTVQSEVGRREGLEAELDASLITRPIPPFPPLAAGVVKRTSSKPSSFQ